MAGSLAIVGGTFDPVHSGHLRLALEVHQKLGFEQVSLMPCAQPGHRDQPGCTAEQRLQMVQLSIDNCAGLTVDDRELLRDGPSYMVHSLASLRQELGEQQSITLVMGTDALLGLNRWYQWDRLLGLANILVIQRPGWALEVEPWLKELLDNCQVEDVSELHQSAFGKLCLVALNPLDISATEIRRQLAQGQSPQFIMPDKVLDFINRHKLYGVKN